MLLPRRDREAAIVSVNGKMCWIKSNIIGTEGTRLCGGFFKEEVFRVTDCIVTLPAGSEATVPLTVYVWTTLDEDADNESFGIDNVVISKFRQIKINFDSANYFETWNCGKTTACGNHQICGGHNVKGKGSYMKRTFLLPAGTYSVELDFIKLNSWFV